MADTAESPAAAASDHPNNLASRLRSLLPHKKAAASSPTSSPSSAGEPPKWAFWKKNKDASADAPGSAAAPASAGATPGSAEKDQKDAEAQEEDPNEPPYPSSWKLAIVTLSLCLAILCVAVDNTILATAIPRITDEFSAINEIGWIGSSYLLTSASFQLVYGVFYSLYNTKWVYLIALAWFELGSLICGAAPNIEALIVGRAIAGIGTAGVFNGSILIIADSVPLRRRPTYTGLVTAMYGLASVVGPLLGGAFTDHATWRWCFYINLPLGAVTGLFILLMYKPRTQISSMLNWREKLRKFDTLGVALLLPMVITLLLALQWGGSEYKWSNWRIILLLTLAGVLLILFVISQFYKGEGATVPPQLVKRRSVWSASVHALMVGAAFFTLIYFTPLWFQAIKSETAVRSGIMSLPFMLGVTIASVLAGGMVTAIGYYTPFVWMSTILMSIGAGLMTTWDLDTPSSEWIGYQAIFGLGVGFGFQQPIMAVQARVPTRHLPIATALVMFCLTMGGALFLSVTQNIFTNHLIKNLGGALQGLNPAEVLESGATNLRQTVEKQFGEDQVQPALQAYNDALTTSWYVAVATSAATVLGVAFYDWTNMRKANPDKEEEERLAKKAAKRGDAAPVTDKPEKSESTSLAEKAEEEDKESGREDKTES